MDRPIVDEMPFEAIAIPRWGDRRNDEGWLGALARDPRSRMLVVTDDLRVPMNSDGLGWCRIPAGLDSSWMVLLGNVDGAASFAVDGSIVPELSAELENTVGVRDAVSLLDGSEAAALLEATGIVSWHRHHPFCAVCGSRSAMGAAGHVRRCESCGTSHFPRTDPAVIMLVTNGEACVLGQRRGSPEGRWSTLAGYVEPGESLEAAVAREVFEEVGLEIEGATYRGSQPWPFPSSLMVAFEATAPRQELVIDDEHTAVRWFEREELRADIASGAVEVPGKITAGGYLIRRWLG
jgi:NAD+ diphosphatase